MSSTPLSVSDLAHKIVVVFPDDLTSEQIEWFWDQGVCMDDWDYMVIVPPEEIAPAEGFSEYADEPGWEPVNYRIYQLLPDYGENTWYMVEFTEGKRGVGVAYHA